MRDTAKREMPLRVERSMGRSTKGAASFGDEGEWRSEDGKWRRERQRSKYLHQSERDDLLYVWGGYGGAVGCKSAMGVIITMLLRAPPRQWPVWESIEDELLKKSGRMRRDKLEKILDEEGLATRHEVRLALRDMVEAGLVEKYVEPDPKDEQISVEMIKLLGRQQHKRPEAMTREERWAHADERLRAFCHGEVPCNESVSRHYIEPSDRVHSGSLRSAAERALYTLFGRDREILERVYGSSGRNVRYKDLFGPELAPVVPYTGIVERARKELVEAKIAERRDVLALERVRLIGVWRRNIDRADRALVLAWEAQAQIDRALEGVHAHEAQKAIQALEQARLEAADCLGEFRPRGLRESDNFAELAGQAIEDAKRALSFLRRVRPPRIVPDEEIARVVDSEITPMDALRAKLDRPPADEDASERWSKQREDFIAEARRSAERLLVNACEAYRARLR